MKKLFILIIALFAIISTQAQSGWKNYAGAKNYAMWTTKWLQADDKLYWKGDTIKKELLIYVDYKTDSVRFKRIDGVTAWSPWYYAGKGSYVLPTASATVKGGVKVGSGLSIDGSGVLSSSGSMIYPGAGIALSTGSAWSTSITNNSANWNTAYGWGNHASQGYVNSILINGLNGENMNGFINFIPGSNVTITKNAGNVTINSTAGGGTTTNAVTFNNSGTGAASGTTFDGSVARTISYNTIGAAALSGSSTQDFNALGLTLAGGASMDAIGLTIGGKRITLSGSTMYFGNANGTYNMTFDTSTGTLSAPVISGASMVYPGAGIAVSTGSAWGTSITNNSSNWNDAYTNMGKVLLFGTTTYGNLSANYFEWDTNSFRIKRDGTPQQNSVLPITSGGVYDALALKADLSGAAFTGAISSTSTMTATDFILSSDKRLKKDISPIKCNWSDKIEFVQYRMKSDPLKLRYGVIAQQVEKYMPELVTTNAKGIKSVSYIDLLIAKVADLENRIKQLENEK